MLDSTEELAQIGSWDWNVETDELRWSDNLYRIFGLEPGAVAPSRQYVLEHAYPEDREQLARDVEAARTDLRRLPFAYRIVRPDGEVRHLRASDALVEDVGGRPVRIVGSVQDITERRQAERTIAAHLAVAEALAAWRTFEQGATELLRNVSEKLDCGAATLWLPESDVLAAHVFWSSGAAGVAELESVIRQLRLPSGVGLAGQVWETGQPATLASLAEDPRFSAVAARAARGALALPARHAEETLAVLEFYASEGVGGYSRDPLKQSLTGIGYEIGAFLAHRRGELKPSTLTPRELEVLQLAAQGCSGREIAARLVVSPATVRRHFEHIYGKYGVSDRVAAVAKALREGLIE